MLFHNIHGLFDNAFWFPGAYVAVIVFEIIKYINTLRKSEKDWAQTYASFQHSCKISEENNIFCGLCKKHKICALKNVFLNLISAIDFVFFAHTTKNVICFRNFARKFKTCICVCPIFFRFFRNIFVFLKF